MARFRDMDVGVPVRIHSLEGDDLGVAHLPPAVGTGDFVAVEHAEARASTSWRRGHNKAAISALTESRRQEYDRLNITGATGAPLELMLPESMIVGKDKAYERHLYADENGSGFRHSDTVVVTEDGLDILTEYPIDIESLTIPV